MTLVKSSAGAAAGAAGGACGAGAFSCAGGCSCAAAATASARKAVVHNGVRVIIGMSSPQKRVTRRAVRPVDLRMTIDAAAADQAIAALVELCLVVDGRGVFRADMTALTEHRQLGH